MVVFFVHRHNVSPRFHNRCLSNCLCRLSSCSFICFFTRTRVNLRDTIVYGDIKIYCINVKSLRFLEKLHSTFRCVAWEPSNRSLPFFSCRTITHWYTDFRSYLDFHKMHDVLGFRSAGHIIISYTLIYSSCLSMLSCCLATNTMNVNGMPRILMMPGLVRWPVNEL